METYFAPPERASTDLLGRQIREASANSVINGVLDTVGGMIAVLNGHRQVVALNDMFLRSAGVNDVRSLLGLRPGEALRCGHSSDMPGGCGTSRHCSTCGAAVAIVTSQAENRCVERKCVINGFPSNGMSELCLSVRACPMDIERQRFLLLFLHDITEQERRAELDRMFFHDVANVLHGLMGTAEILELQADNTTGTLATRVKKLSQRLNGEFKIHRALSQDGLSQHRPRLETIHLPRFIDEMTAMAAEHPAARHKLLRPAPGLPDITFESDPLLLQRVLGNMLTNAFEASGPADEVRVDARQEDGGVVFSVWNRQAIPEDLALRVFERHFSTKSEYGRGIGTWSMKVFGEKVLGGRVSFSSNPGTGTTFRLFLPNPQTGELSAKRGRAASESPCDTVPGTTVH